MKNLIRGFMVLAAGVAMIARTAPAADKPGAAPAAPAAPAAAEECFLVKIQGMDREVTMEVMTGEEVKKLTKDLQLEQRYFSDVVRKVGQEWSADESNKGIPYPGFRLGPRRQISAERFASREKADKQLSMYQDRESKQTKAAKGWKPAKPGDKIDKAAEREAQLSRAMEMVRSRLEETIASKTAPPAAPAAPAAKDPAKKAP